MGTQGPVTPVTSKPSNAAALSLPLFLLLAALATLVYSTTGERVWQLFAALAGFSSLALLLRFGWVVPCMVAGTVIGFFADPAIKGGDHESQMWETVWHLVGGTLVGLFIGILIDVGLFANTPPQGPSDDAIGK